MGYFVQSTEGPHVLSALVIRHLMFEDLGTFAPVLAARGFSVEYVDAGVDTIAPESLVNPDLVVVMGGPIGVYETEPYPFLAQERRAILARLDADKPILGVCLGAQLIARALGARVEVTGRKEIGYSPLELTQEGRDSVLRVLDGEPVLHWHGDQFAIPKGAKRLAQTPGFPNQAFMRGPRVLGLQFHLEADHTRIERWLIGHAFELAQAKIDVPDLRAQAAAYGPRLAALSAAVLNAWLDEAGL